MPMNLENSYDLIIIGGGPAGYAAGIRAGQLGQRALVVEKERAGRYLLKLGMHSFQSSAQECRSIPVCPAFGKFRFHL